MTSIISKAFINSKNNARILFFFVLRGLAMMQNLKGNDKKNCVFDDNRVINRQDYTKLNVY
jgi:hypothetical protein